MVGKNLITSEDCDSPKSIQNAIDEIIYEQGFENYKKSTTIATKKGDNYTSVIYSVKIEGVLQNRKTELNLIVKCPTSGHFSDIFPSNKAFDREVFIYSQYLPTLSNIQEKYQIENGLMNYAKLYKYSLKESDEFLIMDNKKVDGFVMLDRQKYLNLEHCQLVLKQMAYLHGLSFVLQDQKPHLFEKMVLDKHNVCFPYLICNDDFIKQVKTMALRAEEAIDKCKYPHIYEKWNQYKDRILEEMKELEKTENTNKYCVMTHGDCWNNNMLFKYGNGNSPNIPTEVCFLDWQISHVSSPVKDIAYFIYNCTSTKFRENNFSTLLDFYYKNLCEIITKCGSAPEKCYPYEIFQTHLKKYFRHGIHMGIHTLALFVLDEEEIPDCKTKEKKNGENGFDVLNIKGKNDAVYRERVSGIIKHAVTNRFI